ncbi:polyphosphate kinase 1 [Mesoterricola silvestris]|uniref:Polyphosphate kinase n=1 Tax=Mesoterricola silvestris TaxID=2927979 RepID=A0AA48KA28_9BACT|nr:polyphosphate kinase 1 [Mesoterricola silvestris]BDU74584.1 polyphosphate kinase [Mesoterricola silvestris]
MSRHAPRPENILNRELSWLAFNERVLEEAEDPTVPLLERVKFLAITSSNWDEFFMVRVAGIWRQIDAGITQPGADGRTPRQMLEEVSRRIHDLAHRQHELFQYVIKPQMVREGLFILQAEDLDAEQLRFVREYFENNLLPLITPLAVDTGHPFPRLGNRALVLMAELEAEASPEEAFPVSELAVIPIPTPVSARFLRVPSAPGTHAFLMLEDVVRMHIAQIFHGYAIRNCHALRVTRDSDLPVEEDPNEDLMKAVEEHLRSRRRGAVVRLQYEQDLSPTLLAMLIDELELSPEDLYPSEGFAAFSDLMQLYAQLDLPHLKDAPMPPLPVPQLETAQSVFDAIGRHDILLMHPYQSFDDSVVRFVREAADDPKVLAIKMTLYRISTTSPIAAALERAAERGKQVAAIVELRARFDEEGNIAWARRLEKAGVHVVYGMIAYKTHGKACLVIRQEPEGIRRYCHLSTGNYNERTSRLYSDIGLFTARREFGEDLSNLFNVLTGYTRPPALHKLIMAPQYFRNALYARIDRERDHARAGHPARMVLKMNALVDPPMIQRLYEASQDGVQIDLLVRGTCCLRPGVPGLSDNIRAVSIIDRFLEHARVYHFHNNGEPETLLASGDLMQRNLDNRVEVAFPLVDPLVAAQVVEMLELQIHDTVKGRVLSQDGSVARRGLDPSWPPLRSQHRSYEHGLLTSGIKALTRKLPDLGDSDI